jgi:hypothetical protein
VAKFHKKCSLPQLFGSHYTNNHVRVELDFTADVYTLLIVQDGVQIFYLYTNVFFLLTQEVKNQGMKLVQRLAMSDRKYWMGKCLNLKLSI